jgi:hypothetical protein
MTFALLRDRLSAPLEWIASQIAARPKAALMLWAASLALAAWIF